VIRTIQTLGPLVLNLNTFIHFKMETVV